MATRKKKKASSRKCGQTASRAVRFFEKLRHIKGKWAGKPFKLLPWQRKVIRDIFGTLKPDGTRQYKTAYIEIPRKAGKSTLSSGIALYLLFEGEAGVEVYSAAGDREQASIVFEQAKQMLLASKELAGASEVFRRSIYVSELMGSYKVLSADAPTKHGLNPHGIIFDELHVQPNRDLWDALITGTGARKQPLTIAITTAGYDRSSLCWEMHEYARGVINGTIKDPTFYGCIFAAGEEDDWLDPKVWRKANPSLGHTVYLQYYKEEFRKAQEMPSYENTVRRLLLNQWTQQATRWIPLALWDANETGAVNEDDFKGRKCMGGLDLSSVSDLTAWLMVFPRDDDSEKLDILARLWCPEARLTDNQNKYRAQYQAWAKAGWLQTTPGNAIDYAFVKKQILEDAAQFDLVDLNIDPYNAYQFALELVNEGLEVINMRQGFLSMNGPMKELYRRLLDHKINHGGNPVLRWNADNVAIRTDPAGNIKPDKETSQGKIDGIVSLVMAIERVMRHQDATSVYESRGVLSF